MSQQIINIGAAAGDGTGTPIRTSFEYINENFTELYSELNTITGNMIPGPVYTVAQIDAMFADVEIQTDHKGRFVSICIRN